MLRPEDLQLARDRARPVTTAAVGLVLVVAAAAGIALVAATAPAAPARDIDAPTAGTPERGPFAGARTVVLDNGLQVVLRQDTTRPVVAVQMYYSVGARNETTGITGIAHFVEHMLFRGTESFGLSDVTGVIERAGGEWHGYTWLDGTTYFEAAPRALLGSLLRLEAERMTRARMAPDEVDPERGAVFQEYRGYQIDPRSDLFDAVQALLFQQHPYRNNTMGWESDLAGITPADLVSFYRRYYGPRNAVLALAGDFDPEVAEAQVRAVFAPIPAGGDDPSVRTVEPPLDGTRRVTLIRPGAEPALVVSFLAPPPARVREYAALLVLDALLARARGLSFLHHSGDQTTGGGLDPFARFASIVSGGPAADLGTAIEPTRYPGHYSIYATPKDGRSVGEVEDAIFAALGAAADRIGDDEVEGARRRIAAADLIETDSLVEVAHELAFWTSLGGPTLRGRVLAAVREVTAEEARAAATALVPRRAAIGVVLPPAMPGAGAPPATAAAPAPGAAAVPRRTAAGAPPIPLAAREVVRTRSLSLDSRDAGGLGAARTILDTRPGLATFVLRIAVAPVAREVPAAGTVARLRAAAAALAGDAGARAAAADAGVDLDIVAPGEGRFDERDTLQVEAAGPAGAFETAIAAVGSALGRALRSPPAPEGEAPRRPAGLAMHLLETAVLDAGAQAGDPGPPRGPVVTLAAGVVSPLEADAVLRRLERLANDVGRGTRGWIAPAPPGNRRPDTRPAKAPAVAPPFAPGRRTAALPGVPQGRLLIALPGDSDLIVQDAVAWILHHNYGGRLGQAAIAGSGLVYEMDSESARRGPPLALFSMGADPGELQRLEATLAEVLDGAAAGPTEAEVESFRSYAAGRAEVRLAHPDQTARLWTSVLLRGGDQKTPSREAARAALLTRDEVSAAARRMLDPGRRFAAVVGQR